MLNLYKAKIETPLGTMVAIADEKDLYGLAFEDSMLQKWKTKDGITSPILKIKNELDSYFSGMLKVFKTVVACEGTNFQMQTWTVLYQIPYGETRSYKDLAYAVGDPKACRAVANANRCNPLAIIVPCHRVIKSDGGLCGYNGGVERKKWLINHERQFFNSETACSNMR